MPKDQKNQEELKEIEEKPSEAFMEISHSTYFGTSQCHICKVGDSLFYQEALIDVLRCTKPNKITQIHPRPEFLIWT